MCVLTVASIIAAIGCSSEKASPRRVGVDTTTANRLDGTWHVRMTRDGALGLSHASGVPARAEGTITFGSDRLGHVSTPQLPGATHGGVYDIDVDSLGFVPDVSEAVPVAVARVAPGASAKGEGRGATRADSVFIVLSPGASRLSVHIAGALRGDSVVGRWRAEAFGAGGGTGDVLMHHQSPAPR